MSFFAGVHSGEHQHYLRSTGKADHYFKVNRFLLLFNDYKCLNHLGLQTQKDLAVF